MKYILTNEEKRKQKNMIVQLFLLSKLGIKFLRLLKLSH